MNTERFVVVGVTRARARWVADLARWSTDGAAPIEFISCLSATEAGAVLGTGRRVSVLLLDARGPGIDRDLIHAAASAGTPSLVVTDGTIHRDWDSLGCAAVIDDRLDPRSLVELLQRHCKPVRPARRPGRSVLSERSRHDGMVIAVTGPGGAGASTAAMALAQAAAMSSDKAPGPGTGTGPGTGSVALVDGCARGSQAMYHHVGDVVPGLPELAEAHRSDRLDPDDVRKLTFEIPSRGYSLLLGRRRQMDWVTLRRRSVDAALEAMSRSFDTVVVDFDPDLDSQLDTGSADVEDRHSLNLAAVGAAQIIVVVGRNGLHGLHSMAAVVDDLLDAGAPPHRLVPVIVDAPRSTTRRVIQSHQLSKFLAADTDDDIRSPILIPRIRALDEVHERVDALPSSLVGPLGLRILRIASSLPRRRRQAGGDGTRIRPGELGTDLDDRMQLFDRGGSEVA